MKKILYCVLLVFIVINLAGCTKKYTVSFESNGDSYIDSVEVKENGGLEIPSIPYKEGHTFIGWYEDSEFIQSYDFDDTVVNEFTLYGKWEVNQYTMTFKNQYGTILSEETLNYGDPIVLPTITPVSIGQAFDRFDPIVPDTVPAMDVTFTPLFREITTLDKLNEAADDIHVPDMITNSLPLTGLHDSTITWDSVDAFVFTSYGAMYRPHVIDKDIEVTLTATISLDGESVTRDFDTILLSTDTFTEEQFEQIVEHELSSEVPGYALWDIDLPEYIEAYSLQVTWESSDTDIIDHDGTVQFLSIEQGDKIVQLIATVDVGYGVIENTFNVSVPAMDQPITFESVEDLASDDETILVSFTGVVSDIFDSAYVLTDGIHHLVVSPLEGSHNMLVGDEVRVTGVHISNNPFVRIIPSFEETVLSSGNPNPTDDTITNATVSELMLIHLDPFTYGQHYNVIGRLEYQEVWGTFVIVDGEDEVWIETSDEALLILMPYIDQEISIRLVYSSVNLGGILRVHWYEGDSITVIE